MYVEISQCTNRHIPAYFQYQLSAYYFTLLYQVIVNITRLFVALITHKKSKSFWIPQEN